MAVGFIQVTQPAPGEKGHMSSRKVREVTNHLATFADNKKLQAQGLRIKSISVTYESDSDAAR